MLPFLTKKEIQSISIISCSLILAKSRGLTLATVLSQTLNDSKYSLAMFAKASPLSNLEVTAPPKV